MHSSLLDVSQSQLRFPRSVKAPIWGLAPAQRVSGVQRQAFQRSEAPGEQTQRISLLATSCLKHPLRKVPRDPQEGLEVQPATATSRGSGPMTKEVPRGRRRPQFLAPYARGRTKGLCWEVL